MWIRMTDDRGLRTGWVVWQCVIILSLVATIYGSVRHSGHVSPGGRKVARAGVHRYGHVYKLHDDLLRHYKRTARPVRGPDESVRVTMTVFIYQVIKIDPVKNTIRMLGSFELYWRDPFLSWDPKDYGNTTQIFVSSDEIWTPEMSLYYSHDFNEAVVLKTTNDIRLNYTGNLRYFIPYTTESICRIDVKLFPFDTQTCDLYFGSWAHSNESIKYDLFEQDMNLIDFFDNQEWQMLKDRSSVASVPVPYNYTGEQLFWDFITITITVKRQSFYYVFNLVIPSTIITVVAVIGFHTPSTSGRVSFYLINEFPPADEQEAYYSLQDAKFRLGIMTLMSMSVILLAIVEDMPKFSIHGNTERTGSHSGIPLIGLLYFCLLSIIGISTITTSMFVFLERSIRIHKNIPWYLIWLAYNRQGYNPTKAGNVTVVASVANKKVSTSATVRGATAFHHKYDEVHGLTPEHNSGQPNQIYGGSPRQELRRRLSVGEYDNLVVYQYFHQAVEDLIDHIGSIETSLSTIRHELLSLLPQDDLDNLWALVIRRLELISLSFYLILILICMVMFFWHDWYIWLG